MKKTLMSFALFAASLTTVAQDGGIHIIPEPVKVTSGKGQFVLGKRPVIAYADEKLKNSAAFLTDYLEKNYGVSADAQKGGAGKKILLSLDPTLQKDGEYRFVSDAKSVTIKGKDPAGVFYGIQTFIQLLPVEKGAALVIPAAQVEDYPRFAYRGMHLDVGRHFFPVDFVKKYIDYIALHKMNYFHWHLTEDQGWRIEIKKYPKLTETGGFRNGTIIGRYPGKGNDNQRYGGYYTQDEIRDVVRYATARHITIIPEIELPGHALAALTSYPELGCTGGPYAVAQTWGVFDDVFCAGKENTFTFLQNVLDEVITLFPSTYIHIGGDECPKKRWETCPNCQKRIKDENLKDEHELQSYFIRRIEKYLNGKGRQIIGWDEILEGGLAPNATVMSWRGEKGGIEAAKQKHKVIMTPNSHCYIDHSQSKKEDSVTIGGYLPLEKVYGYDPLPAALTAEEAQYVLGAQGNVWTEYMRYPSKVEYMIFPRMSALAEALWSPKAAKSWEKFNQKLPDMYKRYDLWQSDYSKAYKNGEQWVK